MISYLCSQFFHRARRDSGLGFWVKGSDDNFRFADNTARIVACNVFCSRGLALGWREKCGLVLIGALADPSTAVKVEGLNYFADTLLFGGVILSLARAMTAIPPPSA